jgi:MazG family protein
VSGASVDRLLEIVAQLRGPDGCPWDKAQTLHTLEPYLIEEAYEVAEAAAHDDAAALREELGDLLLVVALYAQMAGERGWFDLDGAAADICAKMIRRHPHVFGGERLATPDEVSARWVEHKRAEGRSGLDGVPRALPALLRALRIGEKAGALGFDWDDAAGVSAKVDEELGELRSAMADGDAAAIESELGDVLFAVASLGRHLGVDPERALRGTLDRFTRRFQHIERRLAEEGLTPDRATMDAMEALWQEAKALER